MAQERLEFQMTANIAALEKTMARAEARVIKAANEIDRRFRAANKNTSDGIAKAAEAMAGTAADSAAVFSAELDRLKSKFDPIYAASQAYAKELGELDRAHRMGAISAAQYEKAIEKINAGYSKGLSTGDMSAEIEALTMRFNPLYAASKRYEAELASLDRALKIGALSAGQHERALETLNAEYAALSGAAARSAAQVGASANHMNTNVGNIAAQFQDVGVTAAMGMNPLMIALQQGTQLSAVFAGQGTRSAIAGLGAAFASVVSPVSLLTIGLVAGSAALIQWAMSAISAGEDVGELAKATEELAKATADYQSTIDSLRLGVDKEEVALVKEQVRLRERLNDLTAQYQNSDSLGSRQRIAEESNSIKDQLSAITAQVNAYRAARDEAERLVEQNGKMKEFSDKTAEAVRGIAEAIGSASSADLGGVFARAAGPASVLLGIAQRIAAATLAAGAPVGDDRSEAIAEHRAGVEDARAVRLARTQAAWLSPKSSGGGSGGGGGGGTGMTDDQREAARVFSETRTEAEKLATELAKLERLKSAGLIDADTFDRAKSKMQDLGGAAQDAASAVRSAFDGLFDDPAQALEDLGKQLLQMLVYSQLAKSLPGVFGAGGIIPLVPNAKGGAYNSPGLSAYSGRVVSKPTIFPFATGAGLMGEAGPEAILPLARRNGVLGVQVASGGKGAGGIQIIDQRGANAPEIETQTTRGPDGREMVVAIVKEEMGRGRLDKSMKGRFGARPQKVMR